MKGELHPSTVSCSKVAMAFGVPNRTCVRSIEMEPPTPGYALMRPPSTSRESYVAQGESAQLLDFETTPSIRFLFCCRHPSTVFERINTCGPRAVPLKSIFLSAGTPNAIVFPEPFAAVARRLVAPPEAAPPDHVSQTLKTSIWALNGWSERPVSWRTPFRSQVGRSTSSHVSTAWFAPPKAAQARRNW